MLLPITDYLNIPKELNITVLKRVNLPKVLWEVVGLSANYTSFDLSSHAGSGRPVNQVHGLYHHFNSAPWLSITSTPQCHSLQLESWGALFSPWSPWPSGLHLFLYHSLKAGAVTPHMVFLKASICTDLPAQLNGPPKPNSMFLALQ